MGANEGHILKVRQIVFYMQEINRWVGNGIITYFTFF